MAQRFACWIVFVAASVALYPLTRVAWEESDNTCTGRNPFFFIACCVNAFLAYGASRQICGRELPGGPFVFWGVSAVFHGMPLCFCLRIAVGGFLPVLKGLCEEYMRLLEPNRLFSMQGALRVYCLVWIPSAAGMSVWLLYLAVIARRFQIPNAEAVAGRGWRKCLWIAPAGLLLTASVSARHEMWWDDLGLLERQTARSIMKVWQVYEIEFPGATVTNLAQIFVNRDPSFGETMREKFLAYGLYGGCEDRFYDRYVFVAPGLKGRFTEGELLLIGARPYADGYNRELERIAITRAGTDYDALRCHELREAYVQQLFAEAGRPLPTPSSHRSTKGMPLHVRSVEALGIGAEWAGEFVFGFILLLGWGVWRCARSCFSLEPP